MTRNYLSSLKDQHISAQGKRRRSVALGKNKLSFQDDFNKCKNSKLM